MPRLWLMANCCFATDYIEITTVISFWQMKDEISFNASVTEGACTPRTWRSVRRDAERGNRDGRAPKELQLQWRP